MTAARDGKSELPLATDNSSAQASHRDGAGGKREVLITEDPLKIPDMQNIRSHNNLLTVSVHYVN